MERTLGGLATDNGGPRSATANASTMAGKLAREGDELACCNRPSPGVLKAP
jgi:hypothetical protein